MIASVRSVEKAVHPRMRSPGSPEEEFDRVLKKSFYMGLGLGVALTLVLLEILGARLQQDITSRAQPRVLEPLSYVLQRAGTSVELSEGWRRMSPPWVPGPAIDPRVKWRLHRLGGPWVDITAFRGRVVFLNLWSITCVPCAVEMPAIERLQEALSDQRADIAFLLVTDDQEERVQEFVRGRHWDLPIYLAQNSPPAKLSVPGVPTTFILDREGTAVLRHIGGANWDSEQVRQFIRELAARR